jgi:hypothetical protein
MLLDFTKPAQDELVYGHNLRARGPQHRTQGGSEQHAPRIKRSGRQRDGDNVVARGPREDSESSSDTWREKATGWARHPSDCFRTRMTSAVSRRIGTGSNGDAHSRLRQPRSIVQAVASHGPPTRLETSFTLAASSWGRTSAKYSSSPTFGPSRKHSLGERKEVHIWEDPQLKI